MCTISRSYRMCGLRRKKAAKIVSCGRRGAGPVQWAEAAAASAGSMRRRAGQPSGVGAAADTPVPVPRSTGGRWTQLQQPLSSINCAHHMAVVQQGGEAVGRGERGAQRQDGRIPGRALPLRLRPQLLAAAHGCNRGRRREGRRGGGDAGGRGGGGQRRQPHGSARAGGRPPAAGDAGGCCGAAGEAAGCCKPRVAGRHVRRRRLSVPRVRQQGVQITDNAGLRQRGWEAVTMCCCAALPAPPLTVAPLS